MTEVAALGLRVDGVDNIDSASSSLDRFTRSSKSADQASGGLSTESRNASKALADVAREGDRSSASISKLAGAAKAAGSVLAAAFSVAAISGGIKASLRTYADFETQMARVSAVSRASADDFERLTATARKLGAETEFSASQAGAGLEFLARAGWSATDSIAAIPAVLDLATAASLDLGSAADVASNIMSAYGIAAEDAANVSDILAAATARANTDVRQLGDAMSYVGPVAASLKISMSDSAAAIGALSDAGIQGSAAGTGLRRILSSLANPAKAAQEQLAALGVSLKDVNPQTNDLADIIDTLAASGMDAAQALTVFGDRGGPAILALVEQRFKVRELSKELRDVGGEASQMADVIRDTLEGDLQGLSSAFADVQISIGKAFSGNARSLVQSLTGALRAFGENIETIASTVVLATKLVAAYVVAVYTIPAAKALASAATTAYTGVLRIFSTQVAMTTKQLLSMRTALSLAAAAFAGWEIGTYLRKEFEIVEKAGIALMSGLHQAAIQLGGYFERMGESIRFALTNPLDAFRNKLADLLQSLTGLGQGTLRALGLDGLADTIGKGIETIRSKTGEEHRALLEQMRRDTDAEAAAVSDIYADMFANVGKDSGKSAGAVATLNKKTETLNDTVVDLTASQNLLATAFEQTLAGYHRQLTLAEDASEVEQLLYEIQHGRLQGLLPAQQEMLRGMAEELDMRNKLAQIEADQQEINRDRDAIARELMSEEERIQESYARRRAIIENATFENEQARTELLLRLENERNEALIEASGSYWDRWLLAAEENLSNFDELSKTVVDSFTQQFGNAFEDMIFNAESVGDAVQGMAQSMVRSVVNAIGQMIAQELAYQAIIALRGPTAQTAAAMEVAAIGTTTAAATAATAATTTTQVAAATTTAAAWTPAAFMASIGSFGAAAAIGIGAVLALGALGGFRKGGYTGDGGVDDVAGVVHGKEFVFDAAATARIGVANLEAMRAGRSAPASNVVPFPTMGTQAGPAAAPVINVYEAEGTSATVTTERNEQGQDVINIVLQNLLSDGELATAVNSITGTQYQGS